MAVGNVIQGVPFHFTDDLHTIYEGVWYAKFIGLLDPFSLLAGVVSLSMLVMHGGAWLTLKTEGPVQRRARAIGSVAALVAVAGYALAGLWLAFGASKVTGLLAICRSPAARRTRCIFRWSARQAGCRPMPIAPGSPLPRRWGSPAGC
ncbi:MAG: cytochrome d ubiquinol oxidase subunit II [Gemmobacter sp.]|nr:cytochrome d ubiquinol oxidase subunit II [Gemmobacter sp.]